MLLDTMGAGPGRRHVQVDVFPRNDHRLSKTHWSSLCHGGRVARNRCEGRQIAIVDASPLLTQGHTRWRGCILANVEFSIRNYKGGGLEGTLEGDACSCVQGRGRLREWGKGQAQLPSLIVTRLASECSSEFRTLKLAAMM